MKMEQFYRNLQRMEQLTEMRRIQDEQRTLFQELAAAAAGEKSDTGAVGKHPWSQCSECIPMGVRKHTAGCDASAHHCKTLRRHRG